MFSRQQSVVVEMDWAAKEKYYEYNVSLKIMAQVTTPATRNLWLCTTDSLATLKSMLTKTTHSMTSTNALLNRRILQSQGVELKAIVVG